MDKTYIGIVCGGKVRFLTTTPPADGTQVEVFQVDDDLTHDKQALRLVKTACSRDKWSPKLLAELQRKFNCSPTGERNR